MEARTPRPPPTRAPSSTASGSTAAAQCAPMECATRVSVLSQMTPHALHHTEFLLQSQHYSAPTSCSTTVALPYPPLQPISGRSRAVTARLPMEMAAPFRAAIRADSATPATGTRTAAGSVSLWAHPLDFLLSYCHRRFSTAS